MTEALKFWLVHDPSKPDINFGAVVVAATGEEALMLADRGTVEYFRNQSPPVEAYEAVELDTSLLNKPCVVLTHLDWD